MKKPSLNAMQKNEMLFETFVRHFGTSVADNTRASGKVYIQADIATYQGLSTEMQLLCYIHEKALAQYPIHECGEKIVHLQSLASSKNSKIVFAADAAAYGAQAKDMYLREGGRYPISWTHL
jgi:hypothetical protein